MSGVRRGARSVLKWFSPLYVVLIFVQVFLAVGGLHVLNAILILGMYGWLTYRLRTSSRTSSGF
jgi:hypothetical protein